QPASAGGANRQDDGGDLGKRLANIQGQLPSRMAIRASRIVFHVGRHGLDSTYSPPHPPLPRGILHILLMSSREQMIGVNARWIVTFMTNIELCSHWYAKKRERRYSMGTIIPTFDTNHSIPDIASLFPSSPFPTSIRRNNHFAF